MARLGRAGELTVADDLLEAVTALRAQDPEAAADRLEELVTELAEVDDAHPHAEHRRRPWRGASGRTLTEVCGRPPPARSSCPGCASTASSSPTPSAWPAGRAARLRAELPRGRYAPTGPGTLCCLRLCRRAVLTGYRELDLLRGDEAYKRRLHPCRTRPCGSS